MQLLSSLQFTLHHIFELYKTKGRQYYNFSMLFTIFSLLFSTLLAALVLIVYYLVESAVTGKPLESGLMGTESLFIIDLQIYSQFMAVLTLGLFAIFLFSRQEREEKITFKSFFGSISFETWTLYTGYAIGGIVFSKYVDGLLAPDGMRPQSIARLMELNSYHSPFVDWLISVCRIPLSFLPVILTYFLIRRNLAGKGTVLSKADGRTAFFSLLIVGYCVNVLSAQVVFLLQNYVLKVLYLPFEEALIPSVLSIAAYVFLIAVFYPGLAGAGLFPFLYRSEKELVNENLIDE